MSKKDWFKVILGISFLFLGILVYLVDRESVYFLEKLYITSYDYNVFGDLGNHLPTFIHTFSFCLITAGILSCQKQCYPIIAISWFLFNTFLEWLQKSDAVVTVIPDWFEKIPFLENTKSYFLRGTFDILDILSIAIGAILGFLVLLAIDKFAVH
ncbi:hypothetical protein [Candidatus Parabeggiatoa sp. HSG14]|uniref:hypothetical protein n=1 Tax=Candidatus Parabeggiatoa sp. HSG14 TaxID=3055593 RepID=UPI0025A781AB|nr:hypothetical protein [Thiotrichales bacterium HSG14]